MHCSILHMCSLHTMQDYRLLWWCCHLLKLSSPSFQSEALMYNSRYTTLWIGHTFERKGPLAKAGSIRITREVLHWLSLWPRCIYQTSCLKSILYHFKTLENMSSFFLRSLSDYSTIPVMIGSYVLLTKIETWHLLKVQGNTYCMGYSLVLHGIIWSHHVSPYYIQWCHQLTHWHNTNHSDYDIKTTVNIIQQLTWCSLKVWVLFCRWCT